MVGQFENFLIPNNSIIIAMTGATVGKVAISKEQKLLLNQRVGRIEIKNKEKVNNKYLFYLLKNLQLFSSTSNLNWILYAMLYLHLEIVVLSD